VGFGRGSLRGITFGLCSTSELLRSDPELPSASAYRPYQSDVKLQYPKRFESDANMLYYTHCVDLVSMQNQESAKRIEEE